jgi:hypothetical protein
MNTDRTQKKLNTILKLKFFTDDETPKYKFSSTIFNKKSKKIIIPKLNLPVPSKSRNIYTSRERTMDLYLNNYSISRTIEKIRNTYEMRKKLLEKTATIVNTQIIKLHEKINKMQSAKSRRLPNRNAINKAHNKEINTNYTKTIKLISNINKI